MKTGIMKTLRKIPFLGRGLDFLFRVGHGFLQNRRDFYETSAEPYGLMSDPDSRKDFYLTFENIFRGAEAEISERQQIYLKYVKLGSLKPFLDLGCGRGEFLRLLNKKGIVSKGLEINKVEFEKLSSQGLDVILGDALSCLADSPDDSYSGISAFQLVEHLAFKDFERLLGLAFKKMEVGSPIIIETVNPKCSLALANFYLDPTHVRPYPCELVKFLMEWNGFSDIRYVFSSKCPYPFRVNGFSAHNFMDYAVIGWKR